MSSVTADRLSPAPVTFVVGHAGLGGAERYLETLLEAFERQWVEGVVALADGPLVGRLRGHGMDVEVMASPPRFGVLRTVMRLRRTLRKRRSRVVHANGMRAAALVRLASVGTGVPVVWLKVDLARDGWRARALARTCASVVGISRASTATFGPKANGRIRVVNAAIPPFEVDRSAGRRLVNELVECSVDDQVAVVSGRVCPGKGQVEMVEVAPRLLQSIPHLFIAILGGEDPFYPGYETELRRRADQLGILDRVRFLGHRSSGVPDATAAVRFLSGCDLLVAPSLRQSGTGWREGFGLVAAEAMWVGTPVVAYDSGGLTEVVGPCGRVVPEGARGALGEEVVRVLSDGDLGSAMAECGRQRVAERFLIERAAREMTAVYMDVA